MANQEQTLMLKRVASEFLKVVDPISGKILNFAPLGFAFERHLQFDEQRTYLHLLKY